MVFEVRKMLLFGAASCQSLKTSHACAEMIMMKEISRASSC